MVGQYLHMQILEEALLRSRNLTMDQPVVENKHLLFVEIENVQPTPKGINLLLVEQMVNKLYFETFR